MQPHVNASNHEDLVVSFLDFPNRLAREAVPVGSDVARLQRASEGPCKSASRRRDDVVERCGTRFERAGRNLVVLSHRAVDTEDDRLRLTGEEGAAHRSFDSLNPNLRAVHDSGHSVTISAVFTWVMVNPAPRFPRGLLGGVEVTRHRILKRGSSEC